MNKKVKQLLEVVSKNKDLHEKAKEADTHEKVVEFAKQNGIDITMEDLKETEAAEVNREELAAVAGGSACACVMGGAGLGDADAPDNGNDYLCACALSGDGDGRHKNGRIDHRCICPFVGGGVSYD